MVKRMAHGPIWRSPIQTRKSNRKRRVARPDAMICTGRSDYPNQVNNVLCFRIFCGALDVGATAISRI
jgi:malic enzyme